MKNVSYIKKKARENKRYMIARNHWEKFDTSALKAKKNDIAFMVYDYISAQALDDELRSREVNK